MVKNPQTLKDIIDAKLAVTPEEEEIWKMKADQMQIGGTHKNDLVNAPSHYTAGGIETIEFIRAKLTPEQLKGYYLGNLLKYLSRGQYKNGLQDYQKAEVYLKWLLELEGRESLKK